MQLQFNSPRTCFFILFLTSTSYGQEALAQDSVLEEPRQSLIMINFGTVYNFFKPVPSPSTDGGLDAATATTYQKTPSTLGFQGAFALKAVDSKSWFFSLGIAFSTEKYQVKYTSKSTGGFAGSSEANYQVENIAFSPQFLLGHKFLQKLTGGLVMGLRFPKSTKITGFVTDKTDYIPEFRDSSSNTVYNDEIAPQLYSTFYSGVFLKYCFLEKKPFKLSLLFDYRYHFKEIQNEISLRQYSAGLCVEFLR